MTHQSKFDPAVLSATVRRVMRRLVGALKSDIGMVSIEFMLWIPVVFFIILLAVDVALIYLKQADMWNVARDTARRLSSGQYYGSCPTTGFPNANCAAATAYAKSQLLASLKNDASLSVSSAGSVAVVDGLNQPQWLVTISIPLCNTSLFRVVGCIPAGMTLNAKVTMAAEF